MASLLPTSRALRLAFRDTPNRRLHEFRSERTVELHASSVAGVATGDGSLRMTRAPRATTADTSGRTPRHQWPLRSGDSSRHPRPVSPRESNGETTVTIEMDVLAMSPPLTRDSTTNRGTSPPHLGTRHDTTRTHPSLASATAEPKPVDHPRSLRARSSRSPRRGSRTVHVGTVAGSPAAAPERLGAEAPRPPSTTLGGDGSNRPIPARPVATSRHHRRPPDPRHWPQPSDVPTGRPRPGRKTRRLPPVSPQAAPTTASLRTSEPTRAALRPEHGRSRDPSPAPRERVQVTDRTSPPVPLGTSSRQPISADPAEPTAPTSPPARSAPRNHASSRFPNHAPAGSVPPRRSKPRPGGGPCEPKLA
jgi:hypothetical protein